MELIKNSKYKAIEQQDHVSYGSTEFQAIASWSGGYDTISAVEDDKCIVFIPHSPQKPLTIDIIYLARIMDKFELKSHNFMNDRINRNCYDYLYSCTRNYAKTH